jgi:putative transport protein
MDKIAGLLHDLPELTLFLTLALGAVAGSLKIRGFGLGPVVGTLAVGLVLGQANVVIAPFVKTVFFALFMFGTGYRVGPEFFRGIRSGGAKLVAMSLVFCTLGLVMVLGMSKLLGFDKGLAAGLLCGALTQSAAIGTSVDAIQRLPLDEATRTLLANHVAIGDAVTYLFGAAGIVLFLSKGVSALTRFDLRGECRKYEKDLGGTETGASALGSVLAMDVQAFRLTEKGSIGRSVAEAEGALGTEKARLCVQQIRRGQRLFTPEPIETLQEGDVLALSGSRERLIEVQPLLGPQVADPEVMDIPFETVPVVMTQKSLDGKTVSELAKLGDPRGVHLRRILRQGHPLPRLPQTPIARGDVLELAGRHNDIDRVGTALGFVDRPRESSDIPFMGLAIALGCLVGILSVTLGRIPISLGTGGGVLLMGLGFGWLNSVRPQWGRIPAPAVWLMQNLGLNTFVAIVGLGAALHFVEALKLHGLTLLLAGVAVSMVPHFVTALFGRYVLKLNGGILVGACAGAGTCTPALGALAEESESSVPTLGYTIPYAVSSVLLTAWGPLVVALV